MVTVPKELAEARFESSSRLLPDEIRMRMKAQLSPKEKARRADLVLSNSGNRRQLQQLVNRIWKNEVLPRLTS